MVGINGVARDISERLRLERELSQSEERYRFLVQNSPDIVFSTDAEGRFTFLSDAIERVTGYRVGGRRSASTSRSWSTSRPCRSPATAGLSSSPTPTAEQQAALVLAAPDGRRVPVDVRAIGVDRRRRQLRRDPGRHARRQRSGPAGERAPPAGGRAGRRRGAGPPRPRAARLGHAGAVLDDARVPLGRDAARADPAAARDQLGQLRELQREALAEMRALIFELRPGNLEQDGLVAPSRPTRARSRAGSACRSSSRAISTDRLPLPAEEVLYRIAQEALHNVVKHAAAHQVRVDVRPRRAAASGCASRTTARGSTRARAGWAPRAGRDARPSRARRGRVLVRQRGRARAPRSRSDGIRTHSTLAAAAGIADRAAGRGRVHPRRMT